MSSTYAPKAFAPLFEIEDRHFWFRARNAVIAGQNPATHRSRFLHTLTKHNAR